MLDDDASDVARVLVALLSKKAWFRRGLSDECLCELTGLSPGHVVEARHEAEVAGQVERQGLGTPTPVTMLTPLGVAHAQKLCPPESPSDPDEPSPPPDPPD